MSELTDKILMEIRDGVGRLEVRLDARLDQTNGRLDQTNERLDQTNERLERLERRQVETEVRIVTELVAVQGALREVVAVLREDRAARRTLDDHELRIQALEKRTGQDGRRRAMSRGPLCGFALMTRLPGRRRGSGPRPRGNP